MHKMKKASFLCICDAICERVRRAVDGARPGESSKHTYQKTAKTASEQRSLDKTSRRASREDPGYRGKQRKSQITFLTWRRKTLINTTGGSEVFYSAIVPPGFTLVLPSIS